MELRGHQDGDGWSPPHQGSMEETLLRYRRVGIILTHALVFAAALWVAFLLRFDFEVTERYVGLMVRAAPIFVLIKLLVFGIFRQYSGWWRYVSLDDLLSVLKSAVASAVVLSGVIYISGVREFPRSVIVLDAIVTVAALSALRVMIRWYREKTVGREALPSADAVRTLIAGTGPTAEGLIREATRNVGLGLRVVGIVSEDPRHKGTRLGGVPILGTYEEIPRVVRDKEIGQIVIALESGSGDQMRRIVGQCASADVPHRVLPPAEALMQGHVSINTIRDVSLQDLLGRPPARLENEQIARLISGETVVVTGAGGSIGSELCRQVARFGAARLVLVEQAENPLFHLERELASTYPDVRLEPVIADIGDGPRIKAVMAAVRPRIVLHAAAHKHVPLMEQNPGEAIKNNVLGTLNVIRASQEAEVDRCVLISTDKAVNPTSVMGATKRISEMLMQSLEAQSETVLAAVRFGNVLGSSGSVIPIFRQQIANGGPVTVTHPEMRRYFMTIPEATQLVLQAATYARGGEVFVLDMGEPVYIVDVARDLIRLSGLRPDTDIEIRFTGIRPGEKLFEELSTAKESTTTTAHDRIFRCEVPPPEAATVLAAAGRLDSAAGAQTPPSTLRRLIFTLLTNLERGLPADRLEQPITGEMNVVKLKDASGAPRRG